MKLRRDLVRRGSIFQSTSDTETIIHLVATSNYRTLMDRFIDALKQIEGAYSLIVMTPEGMIACRDPLGIRPLVMGRLDDAVIFASETVALDVVGATFERAVEPGELIIVQGTDIRSIHPFAPVAPRPCIFEWVYFSRPDSIVDDHSVYSVRKNIGAQLAAESPVDADIVIPVPDSGVPAAIGYAQASGIPFELGIIRSHYVGRTFISPGDKVRHLGVKLKHNANRALIKGKRIILVDDSIVRGTTSLKIVQMMRDAGAAEVHMRIASPPTRHSCFYGVDTPERAKLLAAKHDVGGMTEFIHADSLAFVSIDGLYKALGQARRADIHPKYCDACFTGDYPTTLTDQDDSVQVDQFAPSRRADELIHARRGYHDQAIARPARARDGRKPRYRCGDRDRARGDGRACRPDRADAWRSGRGRGGDPCGRRVGDDRAARPDADRQHRAAGDRDR